MKVQENLVFAGLSAFKDQDTKYHFSVLIKKKEDSIRRRNLESPIQIDLASMVSLIKADLLEEI